MGNRKRALVLLPALLALSAAASGLDAKLVRHGRDFGGLDMEIGLYWAQGYTPVGIEVAASGADAGTYVLYAGDFWLDVKEWTLERYAGSSRLEAGIENAARAGWVPVDLAADELGGYSYVLYLRFEYGMSSWRLDAAADPAALRKTAEGNLAKGLLPLGLALDGAGGLRLLSVALPGHGKLQVWDFKRFPGHGALARELPDLADGGWTPFGILFQGGSAGVVVMH